MEYLLDIVLKSTLILLFSRLILLSLNKASATLRHWIISLTMIGLLLLPLLMRTIPEIEVEVPYLPDSQVSKTIEAPVNVPLAQYLPKENIEEIPIIPTINEQVKIEESVQVVDSQKSNVVENISIAPPPKPFPFAQVLSLIWLFGCGFFLLKFYLGIFSIREITIESLPFVLPKKLELFTSEFTKRKVHVLINSRIKTPMTWGAFTPVILLPENANLWSTSELKTVLIHELNHIKRNDYWIHTLGLLAVCFYWYNPLIWLMKRQQLLEREKACDEAVLRAGIRQDNYAEQLINIARQLSTNRSMIGENALPMAKMSQTKARVLAILNFEVDKFQFSAWKQRNWGLLYVFLFPILAAFSPVGKELMNNNYDLPKLTQISQFLKTDGLHGEAIVTSLLENPSISSEAEKANILDGTVDEQATVNSKELVTIKSLSNTNFSLPIAPLSTTIKIPEKPLETGYFRKWEEGKSKFKVWTYGEFKRIPEAPYLEVISDDGIIFIEEYIAGIFTGKSNQLTIAKAPYDCRERPSYKKALDMRPEALIKKGYPIKIWSENRDYDKWIKSTGKRIAQQLIDTQSHYLIKEVADENMEWSTKIESIREWIDFYFMSVPESMAKIERREKRKALKLGSIPFKKINYHPKAGQFKIIGNTTLSGNNVGNMNTSPKGTQYITVLDGGNAPALVKEFNFHLAVNDFKDLEFDLRLYNLEAGEIKYAITKSPIPINVEKGSGWINVDLSTYDIVSKGKVLVVLENKDFSGTKRRKKLYFSLSENHKDYQHLVSANFEWKTKRILERDFVMNLRVEQVDEVSQKINTQSKAGLLVKFQPRKKQYKGPISNKEALIKGRKIVEQVITKLKDNYIQKPYNATLFYRYSSLSPTDSLAYQSEAILKFYDSIGYHKNGWRKAASSRYAELEEGRTLVGEQKDEMALEELGHFFVFWSHEPIITRDKPLSRNSIDAYDYKFIGEKQLMGKEVFEIEFVCTKLKDRFAGLPSLKYMLGRIFVNKEDFAIIRYEQDNLMDYEWKGKHPKKRGHLKERNIIESSRIEVFSKNKDGYFLDYAKVISKQENRNITLEGKEKIRQGKYIDEYQYTNIITENVQPLKENLFKFNKNTKYNSDFWERYEVDLDNKTK